MEKVKKGMFDVKDRKFKKLSTHAQNFIVSLIVKDPKRRLTAEEALKHQWIKQFSEDSNRIPPEHLKETL